jgi:Amidohydrolase family
MLEMDLPVGAGTDATRVASYNPFVSLYWLIAGKTIGGTQLYPEANRLDRMEALRLYTVGSTWFSSEESKKGAIVPGQLADLTVLSDDYFSIPEEQIKHLESVLTMVGGKVVYAAGDFKDLDPEALPVMPEWSPVAYYGGYYSQTPVSASSKVHLCTALCTAACDRAPIRAHKPSCRNIVASLNRLGNLAGFWGSGCNCYAF